MLAFIALPLLAFVSSQSTTSSNASTVDIQDIEAEFQGAQLVPELLSTFTPQGVLTVVFGSTTITPGQNLSQSDVATYPTLSVETSSDNATEIDTSSNYTVMMIDANPVGTDETATQQTRHWLVNGATLTGTTPYSVAYNGATSVTDYAGPGPAAGSGSHRYVVLVYYQPSSFTPPSNLSSAGTPLGTFSFSDYVSSSNLGSLIAANYFQVENGVATSAAPATTPVNTATLSGTGNAATTTAGSGAKGSSTGMGTAASSSPASGTSSGSAAAATSSKGAAGRMEPLGWGFIAGSLGVMATVLSAGLGL